MVIQSYRAYRLIHSRERVYVPRRYSLPCTIDRLAASVVFPHRRLVRMMMLLVRNELRVARLCQEQKCWGLP